MTVQDIINSAVIGGAERFRAALIEQAEMHDDYASATSNALAKRGAENQRAACLRAYDHVAFGAVGDICDDRQCCIVALNVAGRLLGIAPAKRTNAIVAWEETQKERGVW
jgi:hypothetical protein